MPNGFVCAAELFCVVSFALLALFALDALNLLKASILDFRGEIFCIIFAFLFPFLSTNTFIFYRN
jgi:hypothetical protein